MNSTEYPNEPLTETTFLILLSIANEPKHGYAIMKEVEDLSDNRVQLSTGTLYGALNRLLENEWVQRLDETDEATRGRKTYQLTDRGHAILKAEVSRLKKLVSIADLYQVRE